MGLRRIAELDAAEASLRGATTLDAEGQRPKRAERWSAEAVRSVLGRL